MNYNNKVFLVTELMTHYRISLYKKFNEYFESENISFFTYSNIHIEAKDAVKLNYHKGEFKFLELIKKVKETRPTHIIFFWNIHNIQSWLFLIWCKLNRFSFIYWSHGMSLQDPGNKKKKIIYNLFQYLSDAIVLYSENELKFIPQGLKRKTFIANNTINFSDIPQINLSKDEIKKEIELPFKKIVLFVGRIQERKRLDVLIKIFMNSSDENIGLIIAGPDFSEENKELIKNKNNILYLGAIYDAYKVNKLFKCSDLFCIPGTNGLGINQAMYWGLPVLTLNVNHSPEIFYLKHGVNGYILDTEEELEKKMFYLLNNEKLLKELSNNAHKIIREEATPEIMIKGFFKAINYVDKSKSI
ncbi:hypothetical protein A5M85_07290 [Cellulophaga lytica]|uniref:glycosyltransferase family 4 protein n=1 Tax=Cellulophaga lytica TaxID=979 RepID=UPI00095044AE|nr:glycosyltransferase family 4 protein [Cellulophaga lytica]APU10093.1 hypothetical protein A5M85_07290 [Cellulophaga lytica]